MKSTNWLCCWVSSYFSYWCGEWDSADVLCLEKPWSFKWQLTKNSEVLELKAVLSVSMDRRLTDKELPDQCVPKHSPLHHVPDCPLSITHLPITTEPKTVPDLWEHSHFPCIGRAGKGSSRKDMVMAWVTPGALQDRLVFFSPIPRIFVCKAHAHLQTQDHPLSRVGQWLQARRRDSWKSLKHCLLNRINMFV